MAKEKVYKLAQEFKVSSEALVQLLRQMGIPVKSHMSTVDENLREEIKKKFEQERAEIKKEYDRKKQIITKAKEDLIAKVETEKEEARRPKVAPPAAAAPVSTAAPVAAGAVSPAERDVRRHREYSRTEHQPGSQASDRITAKYFNTPSATAPAMGAGTTGGGAGGKPSF